MGLVLQIALGVVLGAVILVFLPQLLRGVGYLLLATVLVVAVIAVVRFAVEHPSDAADVALFSATFVLVVVLILILNYFYGKYEYKNWLRWSVRSVFSAIAGVGVCMIVGLVIFLPLMPLEGEGRLPALPRALLILTLVVVWVVATWFIFRKGEADYLDACKKPESIVKRKVR